MSRFASAAAVLLCAAGGAAADEVAAPIELNPVDIRATNSHVDHAKHMAHVDKHFSSWDADGDGNLSKDEVAKHM